MKNIAIYGAGGHAREARWLIKDLEAHGAKAFIGYVSDGPETVLNDEPVMSWPRFLDNHWDAELVIAVGNPAVRENLAAKAGRFTFPSLVHQSVTCSDLVRFGAGVLVYAGSVITVDVELGRHVHINVGCSISHDSRIADFATLSPGVRICGNVHVGRSVFIGAGATIINGTPDKPLVIGDRAVIGAGACVTTDVEPNCLYVGVPAVLKKRY